MSPKIALRVPSYRRHKPTGQAVVTLCGKDHYLGKWNTAASRAEYNREAQRGRRSATGTQLVFRHDRLGATFATQRVQ